MSSCLATSPIMYTNYYCKAVKKTKLHNNKAVPILLDLYVCCIETFMLNGQSVSEYIDLPSLFIATTAIADPALSFTVYYMYKHKCYMYMYMHTTLKSKLS